MYRQKRCRNLKYSTESPSHGGKEQKHKNSSTLGMTTKRFAFDRLSLPHSCFTRIGPQQTQQNSSTDLKDDVRVDNNSSTEAKRNVLFIKFINFITPQLFDNVIYSTVYSRGIELRAHSIHKQKS